MDRDKEGVCSDDPIVGRKYPYGAVQQPGWCASARTKDDPRPLITGNHPRCATPEGVFDLEGLTKEWIGVTPDRAAVKGGSYYSRTSARCGYHKNSLALSTQDRSIGFRCCEGEVPESGKPRGLPGSRLGDTVADWSLPLLDGGTLTMEELRDEPKEVLQATIEGQGVGLAGHPLVDRFLEDGSLLRIASIAPLPRETYYVACRVESEAALAFSAWLDRQIPDTPRL